MEEEILNTNVEQDYIDKLTELKNNSVSRDEYEKLRADNKKLLDAMFNGTTPIVEEQKPQEKVDIQRLRDDLYGGRWEGTDLQYVEEVLKLRKAIMDEGGADPAVSDGPATKSTEVNKAAPTEADYAYCQAVCDELQACVDYAQGDSAVFRSELLRRINKK